MTGILHSIASLRPSGAQIWSFAGALLCAALLAGLRARDRRHARREWELSITVGRNTKELEIERIRESARNHILESLVSNQSLGTVLDGVAQLIRHEIQGAHCAILLKSLDTCYVGAAPGFRKEWLAALEAPHTVPFEVWRHSGRYHSPEHDPAWSTFASTVTGVLPRAIETWPVGKADMPLGAILVFHEADVTTDVRFSETSADVIDSTARLAQLAIEHSRLYEGLQFQAHHDSLTGLPNRALFEERLGRAVEEAGALNHQLAVLFVDLDHFKQINDTMSHRIGDLLLSEISDRMRRIIRPADTVARIGGDEFNILISNIKGAAEAEEVGARILAAVREPMVVDGLTLNPSASIGIAMFPDDGTGPDELQRQADAAMYCAKGLGRDRVQVFSTRNEKLDRVRMEQELRIALRDGMFAVHYQPKIGADGHFGGLEALLRLDHPAYGKVSPAEFIPIAEESGLIVPLGAWVLDEVCRQVADWRKRGMGEISVAVNVSQIQICRPDFARNVRDCIAKHGVSPWSIELELTESLLIGGGQESQRQMHELRSIGIRFSIDDFGTGYSSLSYLHRLEVDAIKLDRSFVQSIDTDPAARRLVQAMIGVAEGLGLNVVAEGVETEAQRTALIDAGCSMMQGFLFAKPQPAAELENYLRGGTSNLDDLIRIVGAVERRSPVQLDLIPV